MPSPSDQPLAKALAVYTAALPRQARLLHLAGEVLGLLEAVKAGLAPVSAMDRDEVAARLAAGQPILASAPVPAPIFQETFSRLVSLVSQFELLPPLSPDLLARLVLLPPHAWLTETEKITALCAPGQAPPGLLLFLGLKALSPFYQGAVVPFLPLLLGGHWLKGTCPGCGQEPSLATLSPAAGQRLLYCGLCAAQWPYPRHTCVFCGGEEPAFSYVFVEDDPARRADLCQVCGRYLKTISLARMTHLCHLPLEEFVTVDLDILMVRRESLNLAIH